MQQHSFVKFVDNVDLVYLSVPKVASSSISHAMLMQSKFSTSEIGEHSELGKALTNRRPIDLRYPKLPVFTFVRHPVDKFVSYFNNKFVQARKSGFELIHLKQLGFDPFMSIDEVVEHMITIPVEDMEHHGQPQFRILCNSGVLIPDFVGKVETIQLEWPIISNLSGCSLQIQRQRNSSSVKTNKSPIISTHSLINLCSYYETDFELFNYERPISVAPSSPIPKAKDELDRKSIINIQIQIAQRKNQLITIANSLTDQPYSENYRKSMKQNWNDFIIKEYRDRLASI